MNLLLQISCLWVCLYAVATKDCTVNPDSCQTGKRCEEKCNGNGNGCNSKYKCKKFKCDDNQFMCNKKKECIDVSKHCDGIIDCEDETDEGDQCPFMCPRGTFSCAAAEHCLPTQSVCNGYPDCGDHDSSDEENCYNCQSEWQMVCGSNTQTTQPLIDAILMGAEIKIKLHGFLDFVVPQNIWIDGETVYAQSMNVLTYGALNKFSEKNPSRVLMTVSTDGTIKFSHLNLFTYSIGSETQFGWPGILFYVRKSFSPSNTPVLGSTGHVLVGESALYQASALNSPNGQGYSGVSVWEFETDSEDYSKVFRHFSSDGSVTTSKWRFDGQVSAGTDTTQASLKWFINPCWKLVYSFSKVDGDVTGSSEKLLQAVQDGHRILVIIDGTSYEIGSIRVSNGNQVTAQIYNSLDTTNLGTFKDDAAWQWCEINTSGTIACVTHDVSGPSRNGDPVISDVDVDWYIDVRSWKNTYGTNLPEIINDEAFTQTIDSILAGNDVRCMANIDGDDFYFDTINVQVVRNPPIFTAQASPMFVSDFENGSQDKQRYLLIHSAGTVDLLEVLAGQLDPSPRHDFTDPATTKWFMSDKWSDPV